MKEKFNWSQYNESQTKEKLIFLQLLKELCSTVKEPAHDKGRSPATLRHRVFCMAMKVFHQTSSRRLISEIELCQRAGYLRKVPHFNSILNYFNDQDATTVLKQLIELSALPLMQLERRFAVDSTGFTLRILNERWSLAKRKYETHHDFMKAHVMYGVMTNIAVGCEVTDGYCNDSPQFKPLVEKAAQNFIIEEVSADLAYSSRENLKTVFEAGGFPYIPFKKNATGRSDGFILWKKTFQYFKENNAAFMGRYHMRSNAESGFWMIKSRFGEFVKARNKVGQTNEILCKVLCHNLCVLVQEMFLNNVDIDFNQEKLAYNDYH